MGIDRQPGDLSASGELARLRKNLPNWEEIAAPRLEPFFTCWLDTFVFNGAIDAGLRERAILRLMWRCGQAFEWSNHYHIARRVGLSDEEIVAVRTDAPDRNLPTPVAAVVRAADEVVDAGRVTPETMEDLAVVFPEAALLQEFLYVVAGYRMFSIVSASRPSIHQGAKWLPDDVGPGPAEA
jgi:hypothetical protein